MGLMTSVLADGGGQTLLQKGVETLLLLAGIGLVFAAAWARRVRLFGHPGIAAWGGGIMAAAALALAFVVPSMLGVRISPVRPASTARVVILSPRPGQSLRGDPAAVHVRIHLEGGRIVPFTSSHLVPNEGHIHLFLDGDLLAMLYGVSTTTYAYPGVHRLEAEFVAVDHGPFDPPVTASVRFRVVQ